MSIVKKEHLIRDWFIILILIVIDLITKYLFFNKEIWSSFNLIEPAMNNGISFSLAASPFIIFFITLLSLLFFAYMYRKNIFPRLSLVFLFAGTLWNLYDRIVYDGVRDFLIFPQLFIFNLADVFLFVGIVWACIYLLWWNTQKSKKQNHLL